MNETKQVIFKLDDEEYGLDIMNVNAIEKYTNIVRVPNASKFIQGIINLRGDVIPVYSLRTKFGLQSKKTNEDTKLIITKSNEMLIAFEVDSVAEILEIENENISAAPSIVKSVDTAYIDKVANLEGRMIILLDLGRILSDSEKDSIEKMLEMNQPAN
ncbi:chemotaxis protein CheW [Anaeromicropila herbilytica]|uniref:Chemotaxis protein CheW n=1 Tax=Anaeromicropila herbilytica TaxID=2785025 RepID=A0A7R7EJL6_9FIRM|nr:chemotaxis protein CheW [Anaeromicropila herbilytica]BCN29657.1 chemotaxis protein CheW [Anaeromicropila herbilytica]